MSRLGVRIESHSNVPPGDAWLTRGELDGLGGRHSTKRLADWRLGRWTAKAAIRELLALRGRPLPPPEAIEILAADDGAPYALSGGRSLGLGLSLSHTAGKALCLVGDDDTAFGCDLERVEPRSAEFVDSYFTARESEQVERAEARPLTANLIWSAKESALKALRCGLRADTRSVEVELGAAAGGGGTFEVYDRASGRRFAGLWRRIDDLVATLVVTPPLEAPVELGAPPEAAGLFAPASAGEVPA